jgi:hypothetical protein
VEVLGDVLDEAEDAPDLAPGVPDRRLERAEDERLAVEEGGLLLDELRPPGLHDLAVVGPEAADALLRRPLHDLAEEPDLEVGLAEEVLGHALARGREAL